MLFEEIESFAIDMQYNGLEPQIHGEQPNHALSMGDVCDIKTVFDRIL